MRELGRCPMISHYYTLKTQKLTLIDKGQSTKIKTNPGKLKHMKAEASLQSLKEKKSHKTPT